MIERWETRGYMPPAIDSEQIDLINTDPACLAMIGTILGISEGVLNTAPTSADRPYSDEDLKVAANGGGLNLGVTTFTPDTGLIAKHGFVYSQVLDEEGNLQGDASAEYTIAGYRRPQEGDRTRSIHPDFSLTIDASTGVTKSMTGFKSTDLKALMGIYIELGNPIVVDEALSRQIHTPAFRRRPYAEGVLYDSAQEIAYARQGQEQVVTSDSVILREAEVTKRLAVLQQQRSARLDLAERVRSGARVTALTACIVGACAFLPQDLGLPIPGAESVRDAVSTVADYVFSDQLDAKTMPAGRLPMMYKAESQSAQTEQ